MQILLMQLKTNTLNTSEKFHTTLRVLKMQDCPSSAGCQLYIYIYVQKKTIIVYCVFIYRSEFNIDSHGWIRKRPCTVAKQTDCSLA